MNRKTTVALALTTGVTGAGVALLVNHALASGIPATNALTYSGFLEDATGTAIDGSRNVAVELWDAASAGTRLCDRPSTATSIAQGRFAVQLPDACTAAVKANRDTWVQVSVDGTALGRTKLGAVPYAVEADRAQTAVSATTAATANAAGGALRTTLDGLASAGDLPVVTAWQRYSPVMSTDGGAVVANQTTVGAYRRVGDSIEVNLLTTFSNAPGSGTSWYHWSLPTGLTIDNTRLSSLGAYVGGGVSYQGLNNNHTLATYVRNATGVSATAGGGATYYVNDTVPTAFATGGGINLYFTVPITGWTATTP